MGFHRLIQITMTIFVASVFVVDCLTPLGWAVWVLYLLPICGAFWSKHQSAPVAMAGLCSVLVVVGFFLSPPDIRINVAIFNQAIGVAVFWVVGFLISRQKVLTFALNQLNENLEQRVVERTNDLERSERRFRVLCEQAPIGIYLADCHGRTTYSNERCQQIFGADKQQFGYGQVTNIHEEDQERTIDHWRRFVSNGGSFSTEYRVIGGGGHVYWIHHSAIPFLAEGSNVIGFIGTISDITERKVAENAVLDREARLSAVLTCAADSIITFDKLGNIKSANPASERIFGHRVDDIVGCNISSLIPLYHDIIANHPDTVDLHNNVGLRRETMGIRRDGTSFPIEVAFSQIEYLEQFTAVIRDITWQKKLEREIVEIASAEQRRIGQDLHDTVSQELTALCILIKDLQESMRNEPSALGQLVGRIDHGLRRSLQEVRAVIRGLLPVSVDSEGLMAALAELAERTQTDAQIECTFDCPAPVCLADGLVATHLYLIAQESVHNAVKHAKATRIRISLIMDNSLKLTITDNGVGIGPENAHLRSQQTGLGLRIMRDRAAIIGAKITIEPIEPAGTRVECTMKNLR